MADGKPLVLILGATGRTGSSLVDGLLASGNFRVAALTRPSSAPGEAVAKLRTRGVEIRVADLHTDTDAQLTAVLAGVDIVLSAVFFTALQDQCRIFALAKAAGVRRVVPCDWATAGAPGVRRLHDAKLAVREYVQMFGVPYTFIDVGWWKQTILPAPPGPDGAFAPSPFSGIRNQLVGTGTEYTLLLTDLRSIGAWVARVLADERTLYRAVIIWEHERTHAQIRELAERAYAEVHGGDGAELKRSREYVSAAQIEAWAREAREVPLDAEPLVLIGAAMREYQRSMFVLNENSLEATKKLGYLDAQELYPDMELPSLEEFAKEYMQNPQELY